MADANPPDTNRLRRLPLLLLVAALSLPAAWFGWKYTAGRGQVFVAPRCDSGGEHIGEPLRLGGPGCFALLLDDPVGTLVLLDGSETAADRPITVEMAVHRADADPPRITATHAWRLAPNDDQVLFSAADVRTISEGVAGRYLVTFRVGDEVLGERDFDIVR